MARLSYAGGMAMGKDNRCRVLVYGFSYHFMRINIGAAMAAVNTAYQMQAIATGSQIWPQI